jgi:hypothetical protein
MRAIKRRPSITAAAVVLLAAVAAVAGCKRTSSPVSAGSGAEQSAATATTAPATSTTLSEAERHFGVSPTFNKDVEYQPAVIVMEHGAEAIRANSSDGMTWTLDANAPHAAEIQKDRILFATGRAVGRVLAVERKGDTLAVTLGPVELTEVFEKLHFSYHGALDPSKMIAYYAPDSPGAYTDLNDEPSSNLLGAPPESRFATLYDSGDLLRTRWDGGDEVSLRSAVWNPADRTQFTALKVAMPGTAAFGALTDVSVNDYTLMPNCCGSGLGVGINYDKNGIKFSATAVLTLTDPHIDVSLDILHGLKNAFVDISGVGGLKVSIKGGNSGDAKNLNAIIQLPLDLSFPIPVPITGIGTPFSVVFRQSIRVGTIFTTNSTLEAKGEYRYAGAIRAGIRNEQPVAEGLKMSATVTDLAETLTGKAGGVNALLLAYGAKVIVGIGAFNFVVGPYAAIDASVGTTRGSDLQAGVVGYVCRSADVNLWMEVGVGYALPQGVVKAINEFLSLFHVKEISSTYSKPIATRPIYEGSKAIPPTCGKP